MASHLAPLWKWDVLELGNGLLRKRENEEKTEVNWGQVTRSYFRVPFTYVSFLPSESLELANLELIYQSYKHTKCYTPLPLPSSHYPPPGTYHPAPSNTLL